MQHWQNGFRLKIEIIDRCNKEAAMRNSSECLMCPQALLNHTCM